MRIDLASINLDEFHISDEDGLVLITPTKSKHIWREDELHLRSLITDVEGNVLSSGLPKFFNWGENSQHDEEFRQAFQRHGVTFTKKLDGSMVILDYYDEWPRFRTRGNHDLGTFEQPVMNLIREKYPKLMEWYMSDLYYARFARDYWSIIFEYTSPENRIVVPYTTSQLTLLCVVDKVNLHPYWDATILHMLADDLGVPMVEPIRLPSDLVDLIDTVRGWTGQEGVVARFLGNTDGIAYVPHMLKIKSTEYIKLHALKFRLEGKVGKLLYLLGATTEHEARERLSQLGIDFEAQSFVEREILEYMVSLALAATMWELFLIHVAVPARLPVMPTTKEQRKLFVQRIREGIETQDFPPEFFSAAMKWYDGDDDAAWLYVVAPLVLHESPTTVRNWKKDDVQSMLAAPVLDDN